MNLAATKYATLVDLLTRQGSELSNTTAFEFLVDGDKQTVSMTYGELDRQARAIAATLQDINLIGERALLLYPPSLDYVTAFFGCAYAGAVAVPTYPPDITRLERSLSRFMSIVNSARPKVVLTTTPILSMAQFLAAQYPGLSEIYWLATDTLTTKETDWKQPDVSPDSSAFLQYTSGSTSEPKGVMLTHRNLIHQLEAISEAFGMRTSHERCVFWLPFYHDMGLIGGILGSVYTGITNTLMSPLDFLQRPLRWLQAITRTKATVSGGPNFAYELCIRKVTPEQIELLDLSSWIVAFNGAEPVRADTLIRFAQAFEPCGFRYENFYPCYGLAEASLLVTGITRGQPPSIFNADPDLLVRHQVAEAVGELELARPLVGSGHTWTDHRVVIVDTETLEPCSEDDKGITPVGEIWVSGPSVAQGYWNQPEESKRNFYNHVPDSDKRFLRTGDLGFLRNGELFVTGRIKDMVIIDGLNRYPQDIEMTVEKCHPALRPGCSAAFSVEVQHQERLIVVAEVSRRSQLADLSLQQGVDTSEEAITRAIRSAISDQHDLRVYEVVLIKSGSISKTSSGKIQRHACKESYLNRKLEVWEP